MTSPLAVEPGSDDHRCDGTDGEEIGCVDGDVYGPCSSEYCGGVCEYVSACDCPCHKSKPAK